MKMKIQEKNILTNHHQSKNDHLVAGLKTASASGIRDWWHLIQQLEWCSLTRTALGVSPVRLTHDFVSYFEMPIVIKRENHENTTASRVSLQAFAFEPDLCLTYDSEGLICPWVSPATPVSVCCHCSPTPQRLASTVTFDPLPFTKPLLASC